MLGHYLAEVVEAGNSQCCNSRGLICLTCPWFISSPLLDFKGVTVGNSPTALGTLGIYQPLNWARLAGEHTCRVIPTERNHIYHLIQNSYGDITSGYITTHGMALHDITCTTSVHQTSGGSHHYFTVPQNRCETSDEMLNLKHQLPT